MSEQNLKEKIKELRELQRMAEELAQEIETIKDVVKAYIIKNARRGQKCIDISKITATV